VGHSARLNHELLGVLSEALQLPEREYLLKRQTCDICHISWPFYPSMPLKPLKNQEMKRLNANTDYCQVTLLFQDMMDGLEIHDGEAFRPVIPKPGTVVINIGDMMERQTNGRWKSSFASGCGPKRVRDGSDRTGPKNWR
jgi:isopenicillin N synthase-like dioxygenase